MNTIQRNKLLKIALTTMVVGGLLLSNPLVAKQPLGSAVININTARVEELCLLPGIGREKAKAIVSYRTQHPFQKIDELRRVKGIKPKLVETIRANVVTTGATTAKPFPKNKSSTAD
jgi:competence protein ComEA helix-hairpin-helix repeat region